MTNKSLFPLRFSIKLLYCCLAVWVILVLLSNAYDREISDALWIMEVVPLGILWLIGASFCLWAVFALVKARMRSVPAVVVLITTGATVLCLNFSIPTTLRWRLDILPRCERRIAELQRLPKSHWKRYCDNNGCMIDQSATDDVLRVAFMEPGSLLDNFTAIVYDPTGLVLRANEFKGDWSNFDDPTLASVKKLFGGDLFWANPIGNNWYRCGFT